MTLPRHDVLSYKSKVLRSGGGDVGIKPIRRESGIEAEGECEEAGSK
jgi:hypothetical protein